VLRARGIEVGLRDVDDATLQAAVARGAGVAAPAGWPADLAVAAVPPSATAAVVAALLDDPAVGTVTDVASVKGPLAEALAAHPQRARYVGGHPMAGREVSGPAGAREDLFQGRPWVVCGHEAASPVALEHATEVAVLAGARPVRLSPAEHDDAVALVSHTPHLVAALVAARLGQAPEQEVRLAGPGVGDVTRVAGSDPRLWTEILTANAQAVRPVLAALRDDLDGVLAALDASDAGAVAAVLRAGVDGRARLPGKHWHPHETYDTVLVRLSDRPGQLARLFGDVGDAGVNVEDVRIEHVPGERVGEVELDVVRGAGPVLVAALLAAGWSVAETGGAPGQRTPATN
jgi:prephenate dehydrogenase